jgi:hypothetical protein
MYTYTRVCVCVYLSHVYLCVCVCAVVSIEQEKEFKLNELKRSIVCYRDYLGLDFETIDGKVECERECVYCVVYECVLFLYAVWALRR